jgi:hypothetical protein
MGPFPPLKKGDEGGFECFSKGEMGTKNHLCLMGRRFAQINTEKHFWLDRILKICVHLRPNHLVFS